jgi:hypothetical protein
MRCGLAVTRNEDPSHTGNRAEINRSGHVLRPLMRACAHSRLGPEPSIQRIPLRPASVGALARGLGPPAAHPAETRFTIADMRALRAGIRPWLPRPLGLCGCRLAGDFGFARRVAEQIEKLQPGLGGDHQFAIRGGQILPLQTPDDFGAGRRCALPPSASPA